MFENNGKIYTSKKAYYELVELEVNQVQPLEVAGCIEEEEFFSVFREVALSRLNNEKVSFTKKDIETYVA